MNTKLRTRLLIAIASTIVPALLVTQYGQYVVMRRQFYAEFDQNLGAKVRALAAMVEQHGDTIDADFHVNPMQEFARAIRPEYYQLWHDDGRVVVRSRQLQDADLFPLRGDLVVPLVREVILPDGRTGRAAGIRFQAHVEGESLRNSVTDSTDLSVDDDSDTKDLDDVDYSSRAFVTLVVARDTQDVQESLASLSTMLVVSGVAATAVILTILAWLVTRSLRPLETLTRQIGDVNAKNLSCRFELKNAPGELQPVVSRLNAVMTHLESAFLREKTFTADVAHELRTPLAGIRATLEVGLSRERDSESYRSSMQKCLRISEETETIIATLLSLARIESGQAILENDIVDLSHFLQRGWRAFEVRAAEKRVSVDWQLDERVMLATDPGKLRLVVSNLMDNAASYVDEGGKVLISTVVTSDSLRIAIANSGCQLTPHQVERVFDRFWRADVARSKTGTHCGLGLALTRRITEFLNGAIEASVDDGWFTVSVILSLGSLEFADETDDGAAKTLTPVDAADPVVLGMSG